jgi:hypothetical protein
MDVPRLSGLGGSLAGTARSITESGRTDSAIGCRAPDDSQPHGGDMERPELGEQLSADVGAAPIALVVTGPLGGVLRGYT